MLFLQYINFNVPCTLLLQVCFCKSPPPPPSPLFCRCQATPGLSVSHSKTPGAGAGYLVLPAALSDWCQGIWIGASLLGLTFTTLHYSTSIVASILPWPYYNQLMPLGASFLHLRPLLGCNFPHILSCDADVWPHLAQHLSELELVTHPLQQTF